MPILIEEDQSDKEAVDTPIRVSGPRRSRIPYWYLGRLTVATGIAIFLFCVWQIFFETRVQFVAGFLPISILFRLGAYWLGIGLRLRAAPTTLARSESSVLNLRAFNDEGGPFVIGTKFFLKQYTNQLIMPDRVSRHQILRLTLEEFLKQAITAQIGPFVGLGNPADRLPPDGATREYAPDAIWKQRFAEYAQNAKCIVVALGESGNLQWELGQIRQYGMSQKLCLFTPPRVLGGQHFGAQGKAVCSWVSRQNDLLALASTWASLTVVLRRVGYECDPECPGPGAALAFDENGKSVLLTTEASSPSEFVTPVADWFKSGTKTGRWVPGSCSSCQARIYQTTSATSTGISLCYSCQGERMLALMPPLMRAVQRHYIFFTIWFILSFLVPILPVIIFFPHNSEWLITILDVLVGVLVFATPFGVIAGFQWARRAWSH